MRDDVTKRVTCRAFCLRMFCITCLEAKIYFLCACASSECSSHAVRRLRETVVSLPWMTALWRLLFTVLVWKVCQSHARAALRHVSTASANAVALPASEKLPRESPKSCKLETLLHIRCYLFHVCLLLQCRETGASSST